MLSLFDRTCVIHDLVLQVSKRHEICTNQPVASWENLLLVYVNFINRTVRLSVGDDGGLF